MMAKYGVLEQIHSVRLQVKFHLDLFILSPSGSKQTQILPFYGLWYFVVLPVGGNLRNLNTGAWYQIISVLQCLHSKIMCTNARHSKARWTDRQKLTAPAAGEIQAPTNFAGDRGPQAYSCILKTFGGSDA